MNLNKNMLQTIAGLVLVFGVSLYATCKGSAMSVADGGADFNVVTNADHYKNAADAAQGD